LPIEVAEALGVTKNEYFCGFANLDLTDQILTAMTNLLTEIGHTVIYKDFDVEYM